MVSLSDYEHMAMLKLDNSESDLIHKSFDSVIKGFLKLEQYDTSGVSPLVTVLDDKNIMREDISEKVFSTELLLKNAPEHQDNFFCVPAAID